ncbi:GNAT family N-acetyltransferase [uncultured Brevundimonas sp.]|uniref:GNAT family N-acetyltransferase n=1 Tax=uncultured Brevundimonas sp. TaxID=213418 RepID=UPI0030EE49A6|tara:strand:+ start:7659 stop:8192 length:534 start_codon:yes stop_codon:yes gene_type:complete
MTETLTFAEATADDLPALHTLVHGAYRGDSARRGWTHEADLLDGQRIDRPTLEAALADPAQLILLARQDGALSGCVQISDRGDGLAYLGMLSVDPARQGGGLGRRLVAAAEAAARDKFGAGRMEMTVIIQRAELIAWYERLGYTRTGETRPFPATDPRFGLPRRDDLAFTVLTRPLA